VRLANEGAFAAGNGSALVRIGPRHSSSEVVNKPVAELVVEIAAAAGAFAARLQSGGVLAWGNHHSGGSIPGEVASLLHSVIQIAASRAAFAALLADGSVVTWGGRLEGGDSSAVSAQSGVLHGAAARSVFFGFKAGTKALVVWGYPAYGGDASTVSAQLAAGVISVAHTFTAMAVIKEDGSVVSWGSR
jgi:hypothetical protein